MIVSWLLRLAAGIVIGKVWRRLSRRPASSPVPLRPDREIRTAIAP